MEDMDVTDDASAPERSIDVADEKPEKSPEQSAGSATRPAPSAAKVTDVTWLAHCLQGLSEAGPASPGRTTSAKEASICHGQVPQVPEATTLLAS